MHFLHSFWGLAPRSTPKTLGFFSRFSALVGLCGSCGAQAKGRVRQSERSPARSGIYRAKREATNIEKVGPTYFFNLFRTVISLCRLALAIVCKLCPRKKLPPHFAKSGGKRLRWNLLRNILNLWIMFLFLKIRCYAESFSSKSVKAFSIAST